MKNFRAADKSHAGEDEKHDINFHWPYNGQLPRDPTNTRLPATRLQRIAHTRCTSQRSNFSWRCSQLHVDAEMQAV